MHLRLEGIVLTLALQAAFGVTVLAAPPTAATKTQTPTSAEIVAAVDSVSKDPKLGGQSKIRSLRWTDSERKQTSVAPPPPWIVSFFEYLAQAGGLLLWVAGAFAVAIAGVWIYRVARVHAPTHSPRAVAPLNQLRDLDIRPSSLPDEVGAVALELLNLGRVREALSLLYRGALSRAVHRFGVIIGESFTEGEVLTTVGATLDGRKTDYFSDLVNVWRRAVYAGELIAPDVIRPLCTQFRGVFEGGAPQGGAPQGGAPRVDAPP